MIKKELPKKYRIPNINAIMGHLVFSVRYIDFSALLIFPDKEGCP
jgi:hypothetical protein